MKKIIGLLLVIFLAGLVFLLDNTKFGIPALGKLLSPTHGVWQNVPDKWVSKKKIETPNGVVEVYYDKRKVPHLFAPNEKALYYAQGYVQAEDRLWQMDFQTRIAGGKLSEAIGEKGLSTDRYLRRIGLPKIAEDAVVELRKDSLTYNVVTAFSEGVNAYIDALKPKDLPIEFKLTNYQPEPWTDVKSLLLLKLMALRLSGSDTDVANTNTLALIGEAAYNILFPDFPKDESPIIPIGTSWDFEAVEVVSDESSSNSDVTTYNHLFTPFPYKTGIGSNNWAVNGEKTNDGSVILCNDPHLWLSYPSIWYEMQLHAPNLNVYGVTIPGAPCIVIGFNEKIAWGVTNGSRDVKDWFSVAYKTEKQEEYLFDSTYHTIETRIETIKVKDGKTFLDTVNWTKIGPVLYDQSFGKMPDQKGLAMHWMAHEISNEVKTLYLLNKAENHDDYIEALTYFDNPGQNFVYGDMEGNIAIKSTGLYKVQKENEGKFVIPLATQSAESFKTFIPKAHNPHILNPKRNFVSSANQQQTDATYPYYYSGKYETYRNRRINSVLDTLTDITVEDMMALQNDNFNLMAAEILPFLLEKMDTDSIIIEDQKAFIDTLKNWNYYNEYYLSAPSYFQKWWTYVMEFTWDEMADTTKTLRMPRDYYAYHFLKNEPQHPLIDNAATPVKETAESVITSSFAKMVDYYKNIESHRWEEYQNSTVQHLMEIQAFSTNNMKVGGSENSPNANNGDFGPSWRMIVKLKDGKVEAYGVYPGGQSGHPTSMHYDDFVENWRTGKYFKLHFYKNKNEAESVLNENL